MKTVTVVFEASEIIIMKKKNTLLNRKSTLENNKNFSLKFT